MALSSAIEGNDVRETIQLLTAYCEKGKEVMNDLSALFNLIQHRIHDLQEQWDSRSEAKPDRVPRASRSLAKVPEELGTTVETSVETSLVDQTRQSDLVPNVSDLMNVTEEAKPDRVPRASRSLAKVPEELGTTVETSVVDQTRQSDVVPNVSDLMNVTEEAIPDRVPRASRSLAKVPEELGTTVETSVVDQTRQSDVVPNVSDLMNVTETPAEGSQPLDILEMPPSPVLQRFSRVTKRSYPGGICSFRDSLTPAMAAPFGGKRSCRGISSFRKSMTPAMEKENIPTPIVTQSRPPLKQSHPPLNQSLPPLNQSQPPLRQTIDVLTMLQEAGLAEVQPLSTQAEQEVQPQASASDTSESLRGSLDRTQVSLGDTSVTTTDTQRYIRKHWGIEHTMVKILDCMRRGNYPVTVQELMRHVPALPGRQRRVLAARCFNSLLRLKQHQFIVITKRPGSNEISGITLGSRFDGL